MLCASKIMQNSSKSIHRTTSLLEPIHTNICDNKDHLTRERKCYFKSFIIDFSRYSCVYLLRTKDEAFEKI